VPKINASSEAIAWWKRVAFAWVDPLFVCNDCRGSLSAGSKFYDWGVGTPFGRIYQQFLKEMSRACDIREDFIACYRFAVTRLEWR
jgi:hypothetical protein